LHSSSGSFPPPSFLLPASFGEFFPSLFSNALYKGSASANVQSGPLLTLFLLFFPFGLGCRISQVRRNGTTGESSAVHTWAKTTDFGSGAQTNPLTLFRVLIELSEIKVYEKVSEVWCSTFA